MVMFSNVIGQDGAVNREAWDRAVATRTRVGACKACNRPLLPDPPTVGFRGVWYFDVVCTGSPRHEWSIVREYTGSVVAAPV